MCATSAESLLEDSGEANLWRWLETRDTPPPKKKISRMFYRVQIRGARWPVHTVCGPPPPPNVGGQCCPYIGTMVKTTPRKPNILLQDNVAIHLGVTFETEVELIEKHFMNTHFCVHALCRGLCITSHSFPVTRCQRFIFRAYSLWSWRHLYTVPRYWHPWILRGH